MSNWIDLSMPIANNHVRWQTHIEKKVILIRGFI